ncbi:Small auxin-up RNA [Parasponia andersonii]|uniref:Small auxin-up RNA n=1 Tax=Parasponia andersonii TaxID=3476 RepID=A0A2P5BER8_PARAD|nr:Small auxin-up RNA [Parasponia andersonii]
MRKIRGFKLGKRLFRVTRWVLRKTWIRSRYRRLGLTSSACNSKPISKLISWGRRLTMGAKSLCSAKPGSGYVQLGQDPFEKKEAAVPKGHLAVYVGQEDGDFRRVLVPVIYFNHPLFSGLLREAEQKYGFQHQGGITIPCLISEFERVQTRIAAGSGNRKLMTWKRHY